MADQSGSGFAERRLKASHSALMPVEHQSDHGSEFFEDVSQPRDGHAQANLARTIEAEIIPRLMLAHRKSWGGIHGVAGRRSQKGQLDIPVFVSLLIADDDDQIALHVRDLLAKGFEPQSLILELLAPAERRLGVMWCQDTCDFIAVTLAMGRLQVVLRNLGAAMGHGSKVGAAPRRMLLCGTPGEEHTTGLSVVSTILQHHGWQVNVCAYIDEVEEIISLARAETYDVIGLTLSCNRFLQSLIDCVDQLHAVFEDSPPRVLVGGHAFLAHPEFLTKVRYDAFARDAVEAVKVANQLYEDTRTERLEATADCC
ncbi:MAG: cobalamin-dependent protein [Pseudomonadota bacterium]